MVTQAFLTGDVGAEVAAVAARVRASVVEVKTRGQGAGAGTIWRANGLIVTNHHVLPREQAEVTLADGRSFPAVAVARDERNDLAVLRIPASDLPAARIGDARALRPGDLVLAVGHPVGVNGALTVGVVNHALPAAYDADERPLLAADVLLRPGNSGGPLTDAEGRVVGINAMVANGLALAVPSFLAERLVQHPEGPPVLGIAARDVTLPPAFAAQASASAAVLVTEVSMHSAAERAGLLLGDLLVAWDGQPLEGTGALVRALESYAGGPIQLGVVRGGVPREIVVTSLVEAAAPVERVPALAA